MKSISTIGFSTWLALFLSLVVAFAFASNANAQTSTLYKGGYQQQSTVVKGEIIAVRDVSLNTNEGGSSQIVGQLLGGAVGALLGQKSNNYAVTGIAGTLGTVLGGHIGNSIGNNQVAQELIVRFEDGKISAITQSATDGLRFGIGQKVMVIGQGRVAPSM